MARATYNYKAKVKDLRSGIQILVIGLLIRLGSTAVRYYRIRSSGWTPTMSRDENLQIWNKTRRSEIKKQLLQNLVKVSNMERSVYVVRGWTHQPKFCTELVDELAKIVAKSSGIMRSGKRILGCSTVYSMDIEQEGRHPAGLMGPADVHTCRSNPVIRTRASTTYQCCTEHWERKRQKVSVH